MSLNSTAPRAPYALEPTAFPFPALATMAGRASLGGPREIALACFVVARLVADAAEPRHGLSAEQRRTRAHAAKHWLGSATLPPQIKAALTRLSESTAGQERQAVKSALDSVIAVTANHLDSASRLELGRLAQTIEK